VETCPHCFCLALLANFSCSQHLQKLKRKEGGPAPTKKITKRPKADGGDDDDQPKKKRGRTAPDQDDEDQPKKKRAKAAADQDDEDEIDQPVKSEDA
jgi:hypothetical protein